jgi:hypothetical protein
MNIHIGILISIVAIASIAKANCDPVTVGERTIKFEDEKISIGDKTIDLSEYTPRSCDDIKLIDGTRAVAVTFTEKAAGTSTVVTEKAYGVFDVETAKWIVEPFTLENKIATGSKTETRKITEVSIKKKGAKTVLVKKDIASKKSEEIPL